MSEQQTNPPSGITTAADVKVMTSRERVQALADSYRRDGMGAAEVQVDDFLVRHPSPASMSAAGS